MDDAQIIDFAAEMRKRGPMQADEGQSRPEVTPIVRLRTETLRKLLDEHGIPHRDPFMHVTEFTIRGLLWHAREVRLGLVLECHQCMTPRQVVKFIEMMERL